MTRTTVAPRIRNLVLLLVAVAGALLAGAGPASAHAALTGSDPQQGVVVAQAPDHVSLTFSEKVAMSDDSLRVLDPKGKHVETGKPSNVSGTTYSVKLRAGLADGTYTVTYQVVSADSHPVAGGYTFSVGAPSKTTVSAAGQEVGGGIVGGLYGFGRYMSYAGFIVMAGGAAFVLGCWRRGAGVRAVQRLVVSGWLTLTASTLGLLLLRGSYTSTGKVGDVFDLDLLGQVLQTKTGAALVSRLLLLAASALFIAVLFGAYDKREDDEKQDLTFGLAIGGSVVAAGIAASWAMAEHASTGLQPGIAMPVDVLHLLAVAAWLGGLTALLVALYRAPARTPVDITAVRRFSGVAFVSVIVLVATGTYQAWRQLGTWSALTDTRYGQLLMVKVGLVAVLVGIASVSRRWTRRLAGTGATTASASAAASVAGAGSGSDSRSRSGSGSGSGAVVRQGRKGGAGGRAKEAAATAAARKAGAAAGAGGVASRVDDVDAEVGTVGAEDAEAGTGGGKRAAQLARQRAAVAAARQKRQRDADPNRFGLRRSVLAEAGVAVVLLAVTTVLTTTEPGRTEQEAAAAKSSASTATAVAGALTLDMPFDTGGKNGKGVVGLDIDPARVGGNELHLYVENAAGKPYDVPEVKVSLTLAAKQIGPLPVAPDHIATGHWAADRVQIPMAGTWKIAVTVRTSAIDEVTVYKNAQIG